MNKVSVPGRTALFAGALVLTLGFLAAMVLFARASAGLEQPNYTVKSSEGSIEIRQYDTVAAVEVVVSGNRSEATRKAFRILFDYISGNNSGDEKVAMTAPVRQETVAAEIAMTAPVTQTSAGSDQWRVAFYLPAQYTAETAPRPLDERVKRISVTGGLVAAIRFSGRWTDNNFDRHLSKLKAHLSDAGWTAAGAPIYAYFNDPFTLPPLRRNEIQIPLAD